MVKQKLKKMEKRLLDNSFFLVEVSNSVMFCSFFCVVTKEEERKRGNGLV